MFFLLSCQSKSEKAIGNVGIISSRIHLPLFTTSLRQLFPSFIPAFELIVKSKLTSIFLCACALIDDQLLH